jgi:hypothetical protein
MTIALLDACVLYPPAVRDIFMWLAVGMVYQPRWTDAIHDEWMRNVLADRPDLSRDQLQRTRQFMDEIDPESVVTGYEKHVTSLVLPDPDDRHVLAAAIRAGASVIVTYNLRDFPEAALAPHGTRAIHPDHFLVSLLERYPEECLVALRKHRASLRHPPKMPADYRETLRRSGLVLLASQLEAMDEPADF